MSERFSMDHDNVHCFISFVLFLFALVLGLPKVLDVMPYLGESCYGNCYNIYISSWCRAHEGGMDSSTSHFTIQIIQTNISCTLYISSIQWKLKELETLGDVLIISHSYNCLSPMNRLISLTLLHYIFVFFFKYAPISSCFNTNFVSLMQGSNSKPFHYGYSKSNMTRWTQCLCFERDIIMFVGATKERPKILLDCKSGKIWSRE